MRLRRTALIALSILVLAATAASATGITTASGNQEGTRPKRVVVVLVDALSDEIIDRYDMDEVKQLQREGADFGNSYLGHVGAVTVVTHNVLTTGVLPKHMGWTDEGYRDVDGLLTGLSTEPDNPF